MEGCAELKRRPGAGFPKGHCFPQRPLIWQDSPVHVLLVACIRVPEDKVSGQEAVLPVCALKALLGSIRVLGMQTWTEEPSGVFSLKRESSCGKQMGPG